MNLRLPKRAITCLWLTLAAGFSTGAADFRSQTAPLFQKFCFDCHSDKRTKAHLNLQRLGSTEDFGADFKAWEKVAEMLERREMPPEDESQPSEAQRQQLVAAVRGALDRFILEHAGDPGRIALRRLTSAEYAYAIEDLTGLDLGLENNFISDAVGGEGFSNVGDVQFIQDSTLEHYLETAKAVAARAVIGAGPLLFYRDPGKTGKELSAIHRIQEIYTKHGFRTASGEGGKPFGLEHYPKAFYAAWRYEHRHSLGLANLTLQNFAQEEGLETRFVEHVLQAFKAPSAPFPLSDLIKGWAQIRPAAAREDCEKLYAQLQLWQTSFTENTGDAEVASVLTETSFRPALTNAFRIRLAWPTNTERAVVELSVAPVAGVNPRIQWSNAALRFRKPKSPLRSNQPTPLAEVITEETARSLRITKDSFVTTGPIQIPIEFKIPAQATQAELILEAELQAGGTEDAVVRCTVTHSLNEGATVAATGSFSFLLANPSGTNLDKLQEGIAQFARTFPQISHREAAPADRDPIPPVFNNDYNNPERNEFHATIKYYRDDQFLTEKVLDDPARRELDQAWADLVTSFDYAELLQKFIRKKYREALPPETRRFIESLQNLQRNAENALRAAEPGHLKDALDFAARAWRRPLTDREKQRLRSFYETNRKDLDHASALRALLTRILVAPPFLYRIEPLPAAAPASSAGRIELGDYELANRLSFFLWSSLPDAELTRAAAAGELKNSGTLARQARRMLHDSKARRFAAEFFGQWFGFYRFDNYRGVDTTRFTEFTDALKDSMYDEAVSFFEYIVREDRPVREILFADYSFLNRTLAEHYGIDQPNLSTNALTKVDRLDRFHRGGLLRFGAILTSTSAPLRTSAVKRGDWILRRVLGRGVPPPPGDAGSIPPDDVLADGKTVRERLEAHRRNPACVNCHARMDPLGFAMEHFDSIGRWRDTYRDGQRIDAGGKLNDGTEINEFEGLNAYLRTHQALLDRTLCTKLLGYALGRSEIASDRPLLDDMTEGLKTENHFSTLVQKIVASPQFRYRRALEHQDQASFNER